MKIENMKRSFERGILPISILRRIVAMGIITAEQFKEITGQNY